MKTFAISILGSKGDMHPFLAIAKQLTDMGHEVLFFTNSAYSDLVSDTGAKFVSTGCKSVYEAYVEGYKSESVEKQIFAFEKLAIPGLDTLLHHTRLLRKRELDFFLLTAHNSLATKMVREITGARAAELLLYPEAVGLPDSPPYPLRDLVNPLLRRVTYRFKNWWKEVSIENRLFLPSVNNLRKKHGLSKLKTYSDCFYKVVDLPRIALFPTWYEKNSRFWPQNIHFVGFPLNDPEHRMHDDELDRFINNRNDIIIVTPGTGVSDVKKYFDIAFESLKRLNLSGAFISPFLEKSAYHGHPFIYVAAYVDFSYLMKHAKAIIHHGGIGTCARAISAMIPQLIVPRQYDQPDNACRLTKMGLAQYVSFQKMSVDLITKKLGETLALNAFSNRQQMYANDVNSSNASKDAADLLVNFAHPEDARHVPNA